MKFKKIVLSLMVCFMVCTTVSVPVYANEDVSSLEDILSLIDTETIAFLENTNFSANNAEEFANLPNDEVIGIFENILIMKKNISQDGTINLASLDSSNIIKNDLVNPRLRAISETYKSLPSGKYSATTYWTVVTMAFGQTTTSYYMTPNLAAKYANKGLSSGAQTAAEYILGLMIGKLKYGPYIDLIILIKNILDNSFYNGIASLANSGKCVEVRLSRNNYGNFKSYFEWNGRTVRYRSGTSDYTTEKTTIEWSSTK